MLAGDPKELLAQAAALTGIKTPSAIAWDIFDDFGAVVLVDAATAHLRTWAFGWLNGRWWGLGGGGSGGGPGRPESGLRVRASSDLLLMDADDQVSHLRVVCGFAAETVAGVAVTGSGCLSRVVPITSAAALFIALTVGPGDLCLQAVDGEGVRVGSAVEVAAFDGGQMGSTTDMIKRWPLEI